MLERSLPLFGEETLNQFANSHIAVFGLGGVGSYVVEALARQGMGGFSLFDFDIIVSSNKNRQIIALESTIGKLKVEVMKERILDINPKADVKTYPVKIDEETIQKIDFSIFDYVADCIDDVKGKIAIILKAKKCGVPIITCCGTGNKLDPAKFLIKDISKTSVCPLAKRIRIELKKQGITDVAALYSLEQPQEIKEDFISSVSFVPSVAGILIARHILLQMHQQVLNKRIHLVLEGGGMKGVYTAGVLDFFLDKQIDFDAIYGVSAGACTAASFLSKQRTRAYHAMVDYVDDKNCASKRSLTKTGNYFNKEYVYYKIPLELLPFDFETATKNPCKLYATVTNVETGKSEYHICLDYHTDIEYVCASSSLPLLAEIQWIDKKGFLDGGIADSIPYFEAKKSAKKVVAVLTKPKGYRCAKQNALLLKAMQLKYRKYPRLLKAIENRHLVYNHSLQQMEQDSNVFIIRPSKPLDIGRLEKNKEKLLFAYELGYQDAERSYEALVEFLNKK